MNLSQDPSKQQEPNLNAQSWQVDTALIDQNCDDENLEAARIYRLEDLTEQLQDDRYVIFGHGTGSSPDEDEAVQGIFDRGLEVGGVARSSDIDANFVELNASDVGQFKSELDHWPHKDSQRVILARFPKEFIAGRKAGVGTEDKDIYGVFYMENQNGTGGAYDSRFIFGAYDARTGTVTENPNYAGDLDNEYDVAYMKEKYKSIAAEVQRKKSEFLNNMENLFNVPRDKPSSEDNETSSRADINPDEPW